MRVNWVAIAVSAIAFFLFGGLWYDVFFKSAWIAALGPSAAAVAGMSRESGTYAMVVAIVMAFFLAYGNARVLGWRGDMSPVRGAIIGFSLGLLVFGTMTWMDYAFEMRGQALGWINVGFVALGMAIQGAILGAWKPKAA
jgi:hypothetical protein